MRDTLNRLLDDVRGKIGMSPLMTILLVILVPFPLLALMLLVDRWMKSGNDSISPKLFDR